MKTVLAIGGSSSRKSINKIFAAYASKLTGEQVNLLDLNDFEMPIYSVDQEAENGYPAEAKTFRKHVKECDGIVLSLAEHNGSYSAAFKNVLDWASRVEKGLWDDKPMLLLATSPGARGASKVLEGAVADFPWRGAKVIGHFSLPSFQDNFSKEGGITDKTLKEKFIIELSKFKSSLHSK